MITVKKAYLNSKIDKVYEKLNFKLKISKRQSDKTAKVEYFINDSKVDLKSVPEEQKDFLLDLKEEMEAEYKDITPAFIDFETNGVITEGENKSSVLSIAIIVGDKKLERTYFPVEPYNEEAISVNKLTELEITRRREGATYPKYYIEDKGISEFLKENKVDSFVAHNVKFDHSFLPEEFKHLPVYCTMKSMTPVFLNKQPKLSEAAEFLDIDFLEEEAHSALYDAEVCKEIFEKDLSELNLSSEIKDKLEKKVFKREFLTKTPAAINERGEKVFSFGCFRGYTIEEVLNSTELSKKLDSFFKKNHNKEHELYSDLALSYFLQMSQKEFETLEEVDKKSLVDKIFDKKEENISIKNPIKKKF